MKIPKLIILLIVILLVSLVIFGISIIQGESSTANEIACTEEAKLCPDGSSVARIAPDCEFAPCSNGNVMPTFGDAATEEDCVVKGGIWQPWGMLGQEFCQIPAPDGDTACTSGSDCSLGKCISQNNEVPGRCQKYKTEFGCISYVENGKISESICID